jgi:hypothetical protein
VSVCPETRISCNHKELSVRTQRRY